MTSFTWYTETRTAIVRLGHHWPVCAGYQVCVCTYVCICMYSGHKCPELYPKAGTLRHCHQLFIVSEVLSEVRYTAGWHQVSRKTPAMVLLLLPLLLRGGRAAQSRYSLVLCPKWEPARATQNTNRRVHRVFWGEYILRKSFALHVFFSLRGSESNQLLKIQILSLL